MGTEFSAGAVVVRRMRGQWWIAVIEPAQRGNPERRHGVIALPKGNVEPGENPQNTATRELFEETGLRAEPLLQLGTSHYVYVRHWSQKEKISKTVTFFLMSYVSGRIGNISAAMQHEVVRSYWMPLHEAVFKLKYTDQKTMAHRAMQYLRSDGSKTVLEP